MAVERIVTDKAAGVVGPYSQAVTAGGFVFVSGQLGLDPETGRLAHGGIAAETRQALENIRAILAAAELDLEQVVKCEVFLTDMDEFAPMNTVYAEFFGGPVKPARQAVEAARLPKDAKVEISCIAWRG